MALYPIYFSNNGVPQPGLTPTWLSLQNALTTTPIVPPPAISEIGDGWYSFSMTPANPLVGVIDGGLSLSNADRYEPIYIPLGAATAFGSVQVTIATQDPTYVTPIPDVEIVILNQNGTLLVNSALTNSMGQMISQLNPGVYIVTFRKDGYNFTTPQNITVVGPIAVIFTFNGTQVGNVAADFRSIVVPRNLSSPEDE